MAHRLPRSGLSVSAAPSQHFSGRALKDRNATLWSSFVVRSEKAYPVIEIGYQEKIEIIKAYLDKFENLLPIGRSGMFKYNNQDHAMATGLYAARTALGQGRFDPWLVNIDGIYHEGGAIT